MTEKKKILIINFLCVICVSLASFTIYGFKISAVYTFNSVFGFIFSALFLIMAAITIYFYKKENGKELLLRPNILLLAVVLAGCFYFCDWVTTFTFDKWADKECLRQFMVDDFYDKLALNADDSVLSKCTREQAKELLNTGTHKDRPPEITYTFSYENSKYCEADIYYGFKALGGKEYWLVVIYSGDVNKPKNTFSSIDFLESGKDYENGKY